MIETSTSFYFHNTRHSARIKTINNLRQSIFINLIRNGWRSGNKCLPLIGLCFVESQRVAEPVFRIRGIVNLSRTRWRRDLSGRRWREETSRRDTHGEEKTRSDAAHFKGLLLFFSMSTFFFFDVHSRVQFAVSCLASIESRMRIL